MKEYYFLENNEQVGPIPLEELQTKNIKRSTLVWTEGMRDWLPASQVKEVVAALSVSQPATTTAPIGGDPFTAQADPFGQIDAEKNLEVEHVPPTVTVKQVKNRFNAYAVSFFAAAALTVFGIIVMIILGVQNAREEEVLITGAIFGIPAFLTMISTLVIGLSIIYAGWDNIQDGNARTEPGKAVGFLFIPVFHYYWIFMAYRGLVEDMNEYMYSRGYSETSEKINLNMATAACIARVALVVLSYIAFVPWLVLQFIMMVQIKNGLVHLIEKKTEATGGNKAF